MLFVGLYKLRGGPGRKPLGRSDVGLLRDNVPRKHFRAGVSMSKSLHCGVRIFDVSFYIQLKFINKCTIYI